jgi:arylsulfatase
MTKQLNHRFLAALAVVLGLALVAGVIGPAAAQEKKVASPTAAPPTGEAKKPNILFIMGDDVGWFNIGAYHRGMMSGKTPNLDKLAKEGMMFTDYYAEASCTAGPCARA